MTGRNAVVGMLALAVGAVLTACAPAPSPQFDLDDVATERYDRLESRVEVLLESHAAYLRSRWPDMQLPQHEVEAWLEPGQWGQVYPRCIYELTSVTDGARALDLATYSCESRFPPPSLAVNDPGPVEVAWITEYVRVGLPSCLRRSGVHAPPAPDGPFAILSGGSTPGWDPYAAAGGDIAERARLSALCPHPSSLLASIPPLPRGASGAEAP
ncbi:MAG: hypothetical protein RJQ01_02450 [Microcella sp.]|uniref:hypothetical protein n=1 Tax=Microcella sp. TaxID=1913979 RepID=UPI00331643CA